MSQLQRLAYPEFVGGNTEVPAPKDPQPKDGEQTDQQSTFGILGDWWGGQCNFRYRGLPVAPLGSLSTYRWMDSHPTLKLAKGISISPVLAGPYTTEARTEQTPQEWSDLINKVFVDDHLTSIAYDCIDALSLRWQPFEVVWGLKDGYHVPTKFKPLLQERTVALGRKGTGAYVGIRNGQTDLFGPNAFYFAEHPKYGRCYGESRHEACRETAWWPWLNANDTGARLDNKAAGIVFAVKGPTGMKYKDASGNQIDGQAAALNLATMLSQGISVYCPNFIVSAKDLMQYKELAEASPFDIEHFDLGSTADANNAINAKMRYYDSLMFRSWYKPERTALEGQRGTLAEAQSHGDIGLEDSEVLRLLLCKSLNQGPVNDTLEENFGPEARDQVYLRPAPIRAARFEVLRMIVQIMMNNPAMILEVAKNTDMDSVYDLLGVPKAKTNIKFEVPTLQEMTAVDKPKQQSNSGGGGPPSAP